MLHKWLMLPPLPYVQPNAVSFFREQACACPTTRKARLVRTRRKKDAAFGKPCTSGSPFFCFLFFGEAKKSKCPVGTRRMVKAASQFNHKAPNQSMMCGATPFPTKSIQTSSNFISPSLIPPPNLYKIPPKPCKIRPFHTSQLS